MFSVRVFMILLVVLGVIAGGGGGAFAFAFHCRATTTSHDSAEKLAERDLTGNLDFRVFARKDEISALMQPVDIMSRDLNYNLLAIIDLAREIDETSKNLDSSMSHTAEVIDVMVQGIEAVSTQVDTLTKTLKQS